MKLPEVPVALIQKSMKSLKLPAIPVSWADGTMAFQWRKQPCQPRFGDRHSLEFLWQNTKASMKGHERGGTQVGEEENVPENVPSRIRNPEGPARHLDVSRQKLSPHCLETIFDSQLPSPKLSPEMPPKLSLAHKRGHFSPFKITLAVRVIARQSRDKNCLEAIFCPATSRCLFWPTGKAPDTFNFWRHVMRAILSRRPKCSHRCVSLKETPLKPVQILKHTTKNSTEQTVMRTKWFKHIAIYIVQALLLQKHFCTPLKEFLPCSVLHVCIEKNKAKQRRRTEVEHVPDEGVSTSPFWEEYSSPTPSSHSGRKTMLGQASAWNRISRSVSRDLTKRFVWTWQRQITNRKLPQN